MTQLNPEPKLPCKVLLYTCDGLSRVLEVDNIHLAEEAADSENFWFSWTGKPGPTWDGLALFEGTCQAVLGGAPDSQDWDVKFVGQFRRLTQAELLTVNAGRLWPLPPGPPDPLDEQDRDPHNPVEMSAEGWSKFYQRLGDDYEEYMDHDQSMNG
jgi:hypothetical protein